MNIFFNLLESFEKIAYKILLAIIFIPKTIYKIIINPGWAPTYIEGELKQEKSPFDEYISPVILLLVVALVPAVIFSYLPPLGPTISGLPETESATSNRLGFKAATNIISRSEGDIHRYLWYVEQKDFDNLGNLIGDHEIHREEHLDNGPTFSRVDSNTTEDLFSYEFSEQGGNYYVNVEVAVTGRDGTLKEAYSRYVLVDVPKELEQPISVTDVAGFEKENAAAIPPSGAGLSKDLQNERAAFLALALLTPPLIFALATKLFKKDTEINESAIKVSYYSQCYYFSPLSLAIWATYYDRYFITRDIFFNKSDFAALLVTSFPVLLVLVWFLHTETQVIARERPTSGRAAFMIVMICSAILGVGIYLIVSFSRLQDTIRVILILAYPLLTLLLLAAFGFAWYKSLGSEKRNVTSRETAIIVLLAAIIASPALAFISAQNAALNAPAPPTMQSMPTAQTTFPEVAISGQDASPSLTTTPTPQRTQEPQSTLVETQGVPTTTPTSEPGDVPLATPTALPEALRYYTEEFDGNIDNWGPSFLTSGDVDMVQIDLGNGHLGFQLLPREEKIPWVYLVNNAFSYADVKVEAAVTNNGDIANGTSLICRFGDSGWYEFSISNSGDYRVYVYDFPGVVRQGYTLLAPGYSSSIKAGAETNVYSAVCKGNELGLFINGNQELLITETDFKLAEGNIGIAVSAPQALPVDVQFESVTVSEP